MYDLSKHKLSCYRIYLLSHKLPKIQQREQSGLFCILLPNYQINLVTRLPLHKSKTKSKTRTCLFLASGGHDACMA